MPSGSQGDPIAGHLVPNLYDAVADCGVCTTEPVSTTMWRWCDTNNDNFLKVAEIAQTLLGIDERFEFGNIATDDMVGLDSCRV